MSQNYKFLITVYMSKSLETSHMANLLQDWQLFLKIYCLTGYYKFFTVFPKQHFKFGKITCNSIWQLFPGSLYYENLLSIIINFLLFSQSSTSHLAKLLQDWQLFLVVYCLTGCHKIKVFSHLYMSKSLETPYGYL